MVEFCRYRIGEVLFIGWIQTLFLWFLKGLEFGISTISADLPPEMSPEYKKGHITGGFT